MGHPGKSRKRAWECHANSPAFHTVLCNTTITLHTWRLRPGARAAPPSQPPLDPGRAFLPPISASWAVMPEREQGGTAWARHLPLEPIPGMHRQPLERQHARPTRRPQPISHLPAQTCPPPPLTRRRPPPLVPPPSSHPRCPPIWKGQGRGLGDECGAGQTMRGCSRGQSASATCSRAAGSGDAPCGAEMQMSPRRAAAVPWHHPRPHPCARHRPARTPYLDVQGQKMLDHCGQQRLAHQPSGGALADAQEGADVEAVHGAVSQDVGEALGEEREDTGGRRGDEHQHLVGRGGWG